MTSLPTLGVVVSACLAPIADQRCHGWTYLIAGADSFQIKSGLSSQDRPCMLCSVGRSAATPLAKIMPRIRLTCQADADRADKDSGAIHASSIFSWALSGQVVARIYVTATACGTGHTCVHWEQVGSKVPHSSLRLVSQACGPHGLCV